MSYTLDRCPHCGSAAMMAGFARKGESGYEAVCCTCGARGPRRRSEKDAADGWNRRKQ